MLHLCLVNLKGFEFVRVELGFSELSFICFMYVLRIKL